jgi:glycosyltransferase involved in cell wall biosynthesis
MRFYRRATRLQAVSSVVRDAIIAQTPTVALKVRVLPVPLSHKMLVNDSPRTELQHRLCYAGRIHPEKGLKLLLEAFARLTKQGILQWKLRVIGPWEVAQGGGGHDFMSSLKDIAALSSGRVEFLEPEFDESLLLRHYEASDLFLYPSLAETGEAFPAAPLEAMAAYCPALVSDLACFRDFISDGENGFVFDHRASNPVAALAQKLEVLLQNPAQLLLVGKKARATAERYSVERVATEYLEDFELLMRSPPFNLNLNRALNLRR